MFTELIQWWIGPIEQSSLRCTHLLIFSSSLMESWNLVVWQGVTNVLSKWESLLIAGLARRTRGEVFHAFVRGWYEFKLVHLEHTNPVNMKCSACCNKESKRAVRRIVLELSTGKHRSLPSATGRFVLMIFSKVSFIYLFLAWVLRACIFFVSVCWRIMLRRQCTNTFTIEPTCHPEASFKLAVSVCNNCKFKCFFYCLESSYWEYPFEDNIRMLQFYLIY